MEEEILKKFEEQEKRLEEIYQSVEKTRKYFLWSLIAMVVTVVLPLIALAFVLPTFLNAITGAGLGL
jgi:type IV secretory pathway component VirB8